MPFELIISTSCITNKPVSPVTTMSPKTKQTKATHHDSDVQTALPWEEKYRPATLDDVVGQQDAIHVLKRLLESRRLPHLLFHGPPGTGKTSTILAAVRKVHGDSNASQMVLELNASDERNVHTIKNKVKVFASSLQIFPRSLQYADPPVFKIIILDEADAMDHEAQMALRRIMEDYTATTRFCIITNHIHKLSQALVSRCARFRFRPLLPGDIERSLSRVIRDESIQIEPDAVEALARLCKGDMRQALNILQECHLGEQNTPTPRAITIELIYEYVAAPSPSDIGCMLDSLLSNAGFGSCLHTMNAVQETKGLGLVDVIQDLAERLRLLPVPTFVKISWIEGLADIEARIANGGSEMIQTGAIVGVVRSGLLLADREKA